MYLCACVCVHIFFQSLDAYNDPENDALPYVREDRKNLELTSPRTRKEAIGIIWKIH